MNVSSFRIRVTRDLASAAPRPLQTGATVMAPVHAVFENDDLRLTVDIDVADGVPVCPSYQVERLNCPPGLELATTDVLRGIPIRGLMANALARSIVEVEEREDGELVVSVLDPASAPLDAVEAVIGSLKRTRRPITDDRLREFAAAYRRQFVPGGMKQFADSLGYSERQAYRIRKLALERGFLDNDGDQS